MNEVRLTQTAVQASAGSASSTGTVGAKAQVGGNNLPEGASTQNANQAPQVPSISVNDLKSEVAIVNDYVQNIQRDLQFSVDEDLERTVIKVVDSDSGELIRQIPEDIFLELARRLKEDGEVNLLNAIG